MNNKIYDFVGKKKVFFIISLALIAAIVLFSVIRGVEVALEFKGGTIISYAYEGNANIKDVQSEIEDLLKTPVNIQEGENLASDSNSVAISFSNNNGLSAEMQGGLTDLLTEKFPDNSIELLDSNDVNPTSGREFFIKCIIVSILAAVLIIVYIALRFKKISGWSAGVCAVIALIHNLVFVFGAFVVLGYEINSNFVAVVLTILGYSVNDTIVVYDRIRENKAMMPKSTTIAELVNASTSQSLRRSIRTSITTVSTMVIVSVVAYIYGVSSILSFSIPMIFGMVAGTYASLCIASPLWVWWNEKRASSNKKK